MSGEYFELGGCLPYTSDTTRVKLEAFPQHKPTYCTPSSFAAVANSNMSSLEHAMAERFSGNEGFPVKKREKPISSYMDTAIKQVTSTIQIGQNTIMYNLVIPIDDLCIMHAIRHMEYPDTLMTTECLMPFYFTFMIRIRLCFKNISLKITIYAL